jgi:hypothetical protein
VSQLFRTSTTLSSERGDSRWRELFSESLTTRQLYSVPPPADTVQAPSEGTTRRLTFRPNSLQIDETRSHFSDADHVYFSARVGNNVAQPVVRHMGDLRKGALALTLC